MTNIAQQASLGELAAKILQQEDTFTVLKSKEAAS